VSSQKKIYNRVGMTFSKDYIWSYIGQPIWMTKHIQNVMLGKKHTRSIDIRCPSYQLQQAYEPSGFPCNNSFKNKDIILYCYFSMAVFISYS